MQLFPPLLGWGEGWRVSAGGEGVRRAAAYVTSFRGLKYP